MFGWLRSSIGAGIAALVLIIVAASTFAIVPETQQVVVVRLQTPIGTVNRWKPAKRSAIPARGCWRAFRSWIT